jgi:hypothetical protein
LSRTLNDDFDEDDLPGGSLDLEKGSAQVGSGVTTSNYASDGIDFDDDFNSDDAPPAALELDLPHRGPTSARGAPAPGPSLPVGPGVPDLVFEAKPSRSPGAGSSGSLPSAAVPSSSPRLPAPAPPPPPPSEGHHGFAPPPSSSNAGMPPASSSGRLPGDHADRAQHAPHANEPPPPPAKPTAAAVIAKYPAPPAGIKDAPMYAVRVVMRQLELRSELESLRRRRSPDVPLYEAALRAYDTKTFRLGMAINCAALALATFIFFLPVIIRFVRD